MHEHPASCCGVDVKKPAFLSAKTLAVLTLCVFLLALGAVFPKMAVFRTHFLGYLREIGWAVLAGLLIGGLIDRFIPREYISALLSKRKKRTILYSVGFGFLMSACSHGILALSIELYKKGASVPVVVSFLLASPWANLPITLMLIGFFGLKALYIILGALVIAFVTGIFFQLLDKKEWIERNPHTLSLQQDFSVIQDMKKRVRRYSWSFGQLIQDVRLILRGAVGLADMVLLWILLGITISSLAATFIPTHLFHQYMGPTFAGLLATLLLAIVMEVCSEGTAPLAFELYKQTGAFGNAFAFLMAGVVTDYTEIGLLWANIGRRTAIWLPLVAVPQVLLLAYIANKIF